MSGFRAFVHILGHSVLSLFPSSIPVTEGFSHLLLLQMPAAHGVFPKSVLPQGMAELGQLNLQLYPASAACECRCLKMCFQWCNSWSHLREGRREWGPSHSILSSSSVSQENVFKDKLFVSSTEEGVWLWSSFSCFTLGELELPEIIQYYEISEVNFTVTLPSVGCTEMPQFVTGLMTLLSSVE